MVHGRNKPSVFVFSSVKTDDLDNVSLIFLEVRNHQGGFITVFSFSGDIGVLNPRNHSIFCEFLFFSFFFFFWPLSRLSGFICHKSVA